MMKTICFVVVFNILIFMLMCTGGITSTIYYPTSMLAPSLKIDTFKRSKRRFVLPKWKRVNEGEIEILKMENKQFLSLAEMRYRNQKFFGKCPQEIEYNMGIFAMEPTYLPIQFSYANFFFPQARIMYFLSRENMSGINHAKHFIVLPDERHMILFEYLPEGYTLKEINDIRRDKDIMILLPEDTLKIIIELSYTVKSLLEKGIYHWDIKRENIWITKDKKVILFDFDLAFRNKKEFLSRELYLLGSEKYISPNRRRGMKTFSHADEIYSLGKIIDYLTAGYIYTEPIIYELTQIRFNALDMKYQHIDSFYADLLRVKEKLICEEKLKVST